jgi:hypothetical protein
VGGGLDIGEVAGDDDSATASGVGSSSVLDGAMAAAETVGGQENAVSVRDAVSDPLLK